MLPSSKTVEGTVLPSTCLFFWVGIRVPVLSIGESIRINLAAVSDPVCSGMNHQKAEMKFRKTLY